MFAKWRKIKKKSFHLQSFRYLFFRVLKIFITLKCYALFLDCI